MEKKIQRQDEIDRIEVEGKFGVAKRRYSLSRVMAKLKETSEHTIALVFLVMNLEKALRDLLLYLLEFVARFLGVSIISGYSWCSASGINKC